MHPRTTVFKIGLLFCITILLIVSLVRPHIDISNYLLEAKQQNMTLAITQGILLYNDSRLISYVRQNLLIAPSMNRSKFSVASNGTYYSQVGQDKFVDKLLNGKRKGFYI